MHAKMFMIGFLILSLISSVMASPGTKTGVGSIDVECQRYGFDFGIAKWEYEDGGYVLEDELQGYSTHVNGTDSHAYWSSNPAADGVLSKEAQTYQVLAGGTSGEVIKAQRFGISHITLCGYDEPHEEVPEFGVIAALVALVGIGLFVARRRD